MYQPRLTTRVALLGACLVLAACSMTEAQPSFSPPAHTTAPTAGSQESFRGLQFTEIAQLEAPVAMATRKADNTLYVAEQTGRLRALRGGKVESAAVIDLSSEVSDGNEQGLLGIAFSPDGRYIYVDFTDREGHSHVVEWTMDAQGRATNRREVLRQAQPYANHNGGQLAFGPDGYLYIAFGDGGSGGDPQGNGQKLATWLGKLLRINPRPEGGKPYGVPRDNPFVSRAGAKPEIWAYGLRNPWRFSFDPATGDLWIGDVGQNNWEEVDRQPGTSKGGENYGWNRREGRHSYENGEKPPNAVDPVIEYPLRKEGACSVIGGFVYRGTRIPGLQGTFVYGDFCAGWIKGAKVTADDVGEPMNLGKIQQLSSFGVDNDGELYALSLEGMVYRIEPR